MGQILEALNKIQKLRLAHKEGKSFGFDPIKDDRQFNSPLIIMVIIATGIIAAILISVVIIALDIGSVRSNQNKIYNLERSLKLQDREINDLFSFMIKTNYLSDNQIQNLNFRLKDEAEDRKNQIERLTLMDNAYYLNLTKSILANTHQIGYLDKNINDFMNKVDGSPAAESQVKDLAIPAEGNLKGK